MADDIWSISGGVAGEMQPCLRPGSKLLCCVQGGKVNHLFLKETRLGVITQSCFFNIRFGNVSFTVFKIACVRIESWTIS